MPLNLHDRVQEQTSTTGTGTIDLGGAINKYDTFVSRLASGEETYYCIVHVDDLDEWEIGIGTFTDATPDTLSRTTVLRSSNGDALVNFSAGQKEVFIPAVAGILMGTRSWQQAVRVATTANGTLATAFEDGDTIDGVVLATGDRILLKDQSTGSENGIYVVKATGAPDRAESLPVNEVVDGLVVRVTAGTVNSGREYQCDSGTVGVNTLTFTRSDGLQPANNLSDVDTAATAFDNIKQAATTSATGVVELATAAEMAAETADKVVTADVSDQAPSAAKAWAYWNTDGTINVSHNMASITDNGTGDFTMNFDTDFASGSYVVFCNVKATSSFTCVVDNDQAAGLVSVLSFNSSDVAADGLQYFGGGFGAQ